MGYDRIPPTYPPSMLVDFDSYFLSPYAIYYPLSCYLAFLSVLAHLARISQLVCRCEKGGGGGSGSGHQLAAAEWSEPLRWETSKNRRDGKKRRDKTHTKNSNKKERRGAGTQGRRDCGRVLETGLLLRVSTEVVCLWSGRGVCVASSFAL